jgi:dihydrofolate reductase
VVVIGGGEVYRAALPWANRLYLTLVDGEFRGTAYFPAEIPTPPGHEWREVHRETHPADDRNPHPHQFVILDLVVSPSAPGVPLPIRPLFNARPRMS